MNRVTYKYTKTVQSIEFEPRETVQMLGVKVQRQQNADWACVEWSSS